MSLFLADSLSASIVLAVVELFFYGGHQAQSEEGLRRETELDLDVKDVAIDQV